MTRTALNPAKRPHLWELAYFALDLGYAHFAPYLPGHADRMRTLASTVLDAADHSDDPDRLAKAIDALPAPDAAFVTGWINASYFAEDRLTSSRYLVQGAMGRGWVDALGFASVAEVQKKLGHALSDALDKLAEAQNALFLKLDDAALALLDQPVSPNDQRLFAAYRGLGTAEDALAYLTDYILGETLRQALTDIPLDDAALSTLDARMNARLAKGGHGMAQVAWAEVVA